MINFLSTNWIAQYTYSDSILVLYKYYASVMQVLSRSAKHVLSNAMWDQSFESSIQASNWVVNVWKCPTDQRSTVGGFLSRSRSRSRRRKNFGHRSRSRSRSWRSSHDGYWLAWEFGLHSKSSTLFDVLSKLFKFFCPWKFGPRPKIFAFGIPCFHK